MFIYTCLQAPTHAYTYILYTFCEDWFLCILFVLAQWFNGCCCFKILSILFQKIYMEVGTPVSNKYYLGGPSGEMYGLDQTLSRFSPEAIAALRCDTDIPGLYLTGDRLLYLLVYSWICVLRNHHWNVSSYHMQRSDRKLGGAWFGEYVSRHADVHMYRDTSAHMHAQTQASTHTVLALFTFSPIGLWSSNGMTQWASMCVCVCACACMCTRVCVCVCVWMERTFMHAQWWPIHITVHSVLCPCIYTCRHSHTIWGWRTNRAKSGYLPLLYY